MKPQVKMLKDCIYIIGADKLNADQPPVGSECILLTQFLDWVAVQLAYEPQVVTPPFQLETHNALRATFNADLLKEEVWDWFGELAQNLGIAASIPGTELTKADLDIFRNCFAQNVAPKLKSIHENPIMDPKVGTGRVVLAHHEWREQIIIYGVEQDKLSYRIALLNSFLYGMNTFILHADPEKHLLTIDSKNWLSANTWSPLSFADLL